MDSLQEAAMLGKVFDRFVEKSPISVMVRGLLERVLGAEQLDAWYARTVEKQYTRTLLFSTVYNLLSQVEKRSEEHTSELQSQSNLVCRLLLEKKKKKKKQNRMKEKHTTKH